MSRRPRGPAARDGFIPLGAGRSVRTPRLPRQTEKQWQAQVLAYARLHGWRYWRDAATNVPRRCSACGAVRTVKRNAAGHPDLLLIRRPQLIWVELKAEDGRVDADQQAWIDELRACGQTVYVWKPADWPEVERVLG